MATSKPLTSDEKKKLRLLFAEAQLRGLPLPDIPNITSMEESRQWALSKNGYFISMDGRIYRPNEPQEAFIKSTARFSMFYGSRGSGKSGAGAQKALKKIMQGESGAVLNPDFENFRYSTWPEFRNWIDWDMVVPSQRGRSHPQWQPHQPFVLVFKNGARVYCKGLKDPDSARGPNINWLWYDEAGRDPTGVAWQLANASIRVGHEPQAWATTTPKGMNHWLYDFFIEQKISDEAKKAFEESYKDRPLIEAFHGTAEQNKDNLDSAFYASLLATYPSGFLREQEIMGEFANEGGKIGDSSWFTGKVLDEIPEEWTLKSFVRYWDMAATEKKLKNDPDEAVGTLLIKAVTDDNRTVFIVREQVAGHFAWDKLERVILETARLDGPLVRTIIEEEPGSGGKNQVAVLESLFKKELPGHVLEGQRPTERVGEANLWFARAAQGDMYLYRAAWNREFLGQLDSFTQSGHDDRVTSLSGAFRAINPFKSWSKIEFMSL